LRQRACWSVRFPGQQILPVDQEREAHPIAFNPADMVEEHPKRRGNRLPLSHEVDWVLTPALFKRGDVTGEYFDREEVKIKASVVVRDFFDQGDETSAPSALEANVNVAAENQEYSNVLQAASYRGKEIVMPNEHATLNTAGDQGYDVQQLASTVAKSTTTNPR
ncbi:hypothetical protein AOQ84DRAFT_417158, partial [Glonium stellatum]